MPQQMEHETKRVKAKREPDSMGLQKEPFRFYSPDDRAHIVEVDKKKKTSSK